MDNETLSSKKSMLSIFCPEDNVRLENLGISTVQHNGNLQIPKYQCPKCKKRFTHLAGKYKWVKLSDVEYTNIKTPKITGTVEAFVYWDEVPTLCRMPKCNHKELVQVQLSYASKKNSFNFTAFECPLCGSLYVDYKDYNLHKELFSCRNSSELDEMHPHVQKNALYSYALVKQIPKYFRNLPGSKHRIIEFKDTVHLDDAISCRRNGHRTLKVEAIMEVANSAGEIIRIMIPAEYCTVCNEYYIFPTSFQIGKCYGTVLCRVVDNFAGFQKWIHNPTSEMNVYSVLKQYGYNVSKQKNLSDSIRHLILANIIDNEVMTKQEIINYLRSFINRRSGYSKYSSAIAKWNDDMSFVQEYPIASYNKKYVEKLPEKLKFF